MSTESFQEGTSKTASASKGMEFRGSMAMLRFLMILMRLLTRGLRLIVGILLHIAPERWLPPVRWPKPDGPHSVGTRSMDLPVFESNGARRLMARIWYPAEPMEGSNRRSYLGSEEEQEILVRGIAPLVPVMIGHRIARTLTWSYVDAPCIHAEGLPVVIFSHGYTGFTEQNTFMCEHFASRGYIVISLAHPSGASVVKYSDGTSVTLTKAQIKKLVPLQFVADMSSLFKAAPLHRPAILQRLANSPMGEENDRWNEDIFSAITFLSGADVNDPVAKILRIADWSRLGLVGMSLGGSASASAAHQDSRVRAAVNLDGMQQGRSLLNAQIRVPFLVLHCQQSLRADGTTITQEYYGNAQRWVVRGASHFDFTDFTIFGHGIVRTALSLGSIDGVRMLKLTAAMTREFLDIHLSDSHQKVNQPNWEQHRELIKVET